MTTRETGWQEAIVAVLEDADGPLKYDAITQIIGERGLRTLTGATPADTVNAYLSQMIRPGHQWHDSRIRKVGRGIFELVTSGGDILTEEPETDDDDQSGNPNRIVGVPAFGLYWEKDKVRWNSGEILGRQTHNSSIVNFAAQQGVYILHKERSVSYVGRTIDNLYGRLRTHSRDHKSVRWDRFSWFGFCNVDDHTAELKPMPSEVTPAHLISILESVLIEALEPPVNGRRGDYLGVQYEQVPDPEIATQLSRAFLRSLTG